MNQKNQEVETGENPNADTALIGCYLLKAGIAGKAKEEIKDKVFEAIIANREKAYGKGYQLGVIGTATGDFKVEEEIEAIKSEAKKELTSEIKKWAKKNVFDPEPILTFIKSLC